MFEINVGDANVCINDVQTKGGFCAGERLEAKYVDHVLFAREPMSRSRSQFISFR